MSTAEHTPLPDEQRFVLSSLPPSQGQKRLAAGIVLGLLVALYLVLGPFGGMQLGVIHSFVAVYATAMLMTDAITAILLYAQFSILRSRAILVIASGYLFTSFLIVPYTLAFPGVLSPNGVIGGLQTTAQLYLLWHCGFPLFVIGYALLKDEDPTKRVSQAQVRSAILAASAGPRPSRRQPHSFARRAKRYCPASCWIRTILPPTGPMLSVRQSDCYAVAPLSCCGKDGDRFSISS